MALTGQLSDMSLAELIEFFCNQRKTGRLKIDYQRGHSVFFIKEGELVDAKVGALSGSEAVYFSLTLPNAAFDFSPDVQATRRTIHNAWTQVVLEGLRRLDEGHSPTEADAFGAWSPSETELAQMLDQVEHLDNLNQPKHAREKERAARAAASDGAPKSEESAVKESSPEPFSMMVESAGATGGSKKKFVLAGVAAAVVLACAVAAVPLMNRAPAKSAADTAANAPAAAAPVAPAPAEAQPAEASADAAAAAPESTDTAAADAARREERERKERERRRREEAAKKDDAANSLNPADPAAAAAAPKPATPSGPKSVKVTVTYDEAGRVTAASVAGATPGAEAYGSTAVRMARGKRFPAGKPGSTVVTIPVN